MYASSLGAFKPLSQQLAFNIIKIDKSFIADIAINPISHIIVASVIGLGKKLGLTLIAEGVENAEQLTILRKLNCDMVQGYFYSKPLVQEKFTKKFQRFDVAF